MMLLLLMLLLILLMLLLLLMMMMMMTVEWRRRLAQAARETTPRAYQMRRRHLLREIEALKILLLLSVSIPQYPPYPCPYPPLNALHRFPYRWSALTGGGRGGGELGEMPKHHCRQR
jgi:hypothetical protein